MCTANYADFNEDNLFYCVLSESVCCGLCNLLLFGKVQLKCVKHSDGGCYYAYHQPVLGRFDRAELVFIAMVRLGRECSRVIHSIAHLKNQLWSIILTTSQKYRNPCCPKSSHGNS